MPVNLYSRKIVPLQKVKAAALPLPPWAISIPCVFMHPHEVRAAAHPLFAHAPALSLPLLLNAHVQAG